MYQKSFNYFRNSNVICHKEIASMESKELNIANYMFWFLTFDIMILYIMNNEEKVMSFESHRNLFKLLKYDDNAVLY